MPGNYSHTYRADGTVLTAAIYNQDHQNHINNMTPAGVDDYSTSVTEMRAATDPGETGSESFATSLAGEIERLRFAIQDIKAYLGLQGAYWYNSPSGLITPALVNDHSANVGQMQAMTNPGSTGSESLATDLRGEIERLRYCIKQIKDTMSPVTNWYDPASFAPVGPAGSYVRGLTGTAGGNTITLEASEILVRNSTGDHKWLSGIASKTCNITTHGTNGRDSATAFPNDSWVYVYYVWDGTSVNLLASLTGLPTGPNLSGSGHTHFALATIVKMSGSSIITSYIRGRHVGWADQTQLTSSTSPSTAVSFSCPYTAGLESTHVSLSLTASSSNNNGNYSYSGKIMAGTSGMLGEVRFDIPRWNFDSTGSGTNAFFVPSLSTYYRTHSFSAGSSTFTIYMAGYTVQNGA